MKKCSDPWVNVDNQREEIVNRKCCSKRITKKEY